MKTELGGRSVLSFMVVGGILMSGCGSSGGDARSGDSGIAASAPTSAKAETAMAAEPQPPSGWKTLTSEAGNFALLMPETTENKTLAIPSKMGNLKAQMVSAGVKATGNAYLLMYVDYPRLAQRQAPRDDRRLFQFVQADKTRC